MEILSETRRKMFWTVLLSRMLDERAWDLHHQRKINYHVSAIGHEAAQVAAGFALQRGLDWVTPYYRDIALLLTLGFTPRQYMLSLMGKKDDPVSGGRQMPGNWSYKEANVLSYSTPLATQISHAVGIALGFKLRGEAKIVLASCGEGATSQGEWYEALNWAAVQKLPVVFFVQNNRYAISLPQKKQMAVDNVVDKARGLGVESILLDGTLLFDTYLTIQEVVEKVRTGGGPVLVEVMVNRITPHSSDDDDRMYRTRDEVLDARKQDPLELARLLLKEDGDLTDEQFNKMKIEVEGIVEDAVQFAESAPLPRAQDAAFPVYYGEVRHG